MAKGSDNDFPSILVTEQASKPSSPASGKQRLYMKTDHKLYHVDNGGTETEVGVGGNKGISYTDRNDYSGGTIALNSVSWADVQNSLDLSLTASTGDVIQVGVSGLLAANAVDVAFDVCSIVSGSPVNYISNGAGTPGGNGIDAWYSEASHLSKIGAPIIYTLVAGDISGGTTTLRLRYKSASATSRSLVADASGILTFWGINLSR